MTEKHRGRKRGKEKERELKLKRRESAGEDNNYIEKIRNMLLQGEGEYGDKDR